MVDSNIATVVAVSGQAYARNTEGELRELRAGDVLREGENVISPNGGYVELEMVDGNPLLLRNMPEMAMTKDLVSTVAAGREAREEEEQSLKELLNTLDDEVDLNTVIEATSTGKEHFHGSDVSLDMRDLLTDDSLETAESVVYPGEDSDSNPGAVERLAANASVDNSSGEADQFTNQEGVDISATNSVNMIAQEMLQAGQLVSD